MSESPKTILVVDDSAVDRLVARRLLEKHGGWTVAQAGDGAEALAAFGRSDATAATRSGIALEEALLNAVYHGNLGVSSELKQQGNGLFEKTATDRRQREPYRDRRVFVTVELTSQAATFVIEDQ